MNRRAFCSRAAAVAALTVAARCLDGTGVGDSNETDGGNDTADPNTEYNGESVEDS